MSDDKPAREIQEYLARPTTVRFISCARNFIAVLELKNLSKSQFLTKSHSALLELYSAGHFLEVIKLKYSNAESDFDRVSLFEPVASLPELGEEAYYWEVFDPTYIERDGKPGLGWEISDKEASQGWLIDDFGDIYRDLKIALNMIDSIATDEAIEDALWELKWGFFHHWGNHCINALRYLHYLYYEGKNAI